jgi:hypothetical protein
MKVEIANPIYDAVFKYMMEDNAVAKLLVSSIIDEEIISLDAKPQEYTVEKVTAEGNTLSVYRLDFSAKIRTTDGFKLVLIEMQKASFPADIMRFRRYLGKQYADENNSEEREDGTVKALPIYTIYFLGKELGIYTTPVLKVFPNVMDLGVNQVVDVKSEFIESLNHHSWIVQISCLKEPHRNELELLLSVFDQNNRTSDHHILNVCEEDFPEKYRPLIRRLKQAAAIPEIKEQMTAEDEILNYFKNYCRSEVFKVQKKLEIVIAQKDEELVKKDEELVKKDEELVKKDEELEEERKKNEALRLKLQQAGLL